MSADIKRKRIDSELNMLGRLPDGYKVTVEEGNGRIKIFINIDSKIIQSELKPEGIGTYTFTIILDEDFPFKGPQVQ